MDRYTELAVTDDPQYLDWVDALVAGVEEAIQTDLTFVVKIDNWFGQRWLGFSGKALGVLSICKTKLTLPPFIPSRVVSQRRFWDDGTDPGRHKPLHVWQRSGQNLQRYTDVVLQGAHVFWYSGQSASNERASFMAYVSNARRVLALVRKLAAQRDLASCGMHRHQHSGARGVYPPRHRKL